MSGFLDGLSGVMDSLSSVAKLGAAGYSLYSGITNANAANDYYGRLAGSAELQDELAKKAADREAPVLDAQAKANLSDLERYLKGDFQDFRTQIDKAAYDNTLAQNKLTGQTLDFYSKIMPDLGKSLGLRAQYETALLPWEQAVSVGGLKNADSQNKLGAEMLGLAHEWQPKLAEEQYALQADQLRSAKGDVADYEAGRKGAQEFVRQSIDGIGHAPAMSRAGANVEQAFAGAEDATRRELQRRGVSLGSGMAVDALRRGAIAKALATGAARTKAWNDTDATNYSRLGNLVNVRNGFNAGAAAPGVSLSAPSSISPRTGLSLPTSSTGGQMASGSTPSNTAGPVNSSASSMWGNLAAGAGHAAGSDLESAGYLLNRR